jgi:hypothetical protein
MHALAVCRAGPFTTFFKQIGGCPLLILHESPKSVMAQYSDFAGLRHGYIDQVAHAYGWYEISHKDDGIVTTVVKSCTNE